MVAVVAQKEGRHFIGFEVVPEYCAFAQDALSPQNGKR
jgi:DNA modification methylase